FPRDGRADVRLVLVVGRDEVDLHALAFGGQAVVDREPGRDDRAGSTHRCVGARHVAEHADLHDGLRMGRREAEAHRDNDAHRQSTKRRRDGPWIGPGRFRHGDSSNGQGWGTRRAGGLRGKSRPASPRSRHALVHNRVFSLFDRLVNLQGATDMPYPGKRPLGRSGIQIAPLVLGGNVFGWTADEVTSFRILDRFIDAGFDAIDTADAYSAWAPGNKGGESETIIGNWLAADPSRRDRCVIITKAGAALKE